MADPVVISVSNVTLTTSSSQTPSVTVPTGANAFVIGSEYYTSSTQAITFSGSGWMSVQASGGDWDFNFANNAYAAGKVTATGSRTLSVSATRAFEEGPTCQIIWLTVENPDDWILDHKVAPPNASPTTLSATVTSQTGGLVVGIFGSFSTPSAPSGTTQLGTSQTTNGHTALAYSANTVGATTTTITSASYDFPSLSIVSAKAGAAGTTHAATGALVGPGSVVAGSAARTRTHPSSGSLTGQGSSIAGSAQHNTPHASSGDLVGPGSTLAGAAARTRQHPSSGDLVGPGSTVAGTAARTRAHASSGVLTGPGSVVDGAAARTRQHASSGDLVGPGSVIVGSADHQAAAGTHDATGALVGPGSAIAGAAARKRTFASSGALVGPGSVVVGSAARVAGSVSHDATGALVGPGSIINGTAARANPPVSHNATGALIGPGSIVVGEARNGAEDPQVGIFWPPFWWYKNEELEEELEKLAPEVKEVIIEAAEKAINDEPVEIRAELKKEKIRYRNQYKEIYLRIVEEMRQSEEDEEIAAIVAFL